MLNQPVQQANSGDNNMREMEMFANNGVVNRKGFRFIMPIRI